MKATTSTQFGQKFQQPTIEEIKKQGKRSQAESTSKSHRDIVVNDIQYLLKWAYNQKT